MLDTTTTETHDEPTLVPGTMVEIEVTILQILLAAVDAGCQKGAYLANQISNVGRAFDTGVSILQGAVKNVH